MVFIVAEERGWGREVQLAEAAPMQGANGVGNIRTEVEHTRKEAQRWI